MTHDYMQENLDNLDKDSELQAEIIKSQHALIHKLERDIAEADRRAGAAERHLSYANKSIEARCRWLDKAKQDAGYHRSVSFDVVWDAALKVYLESKKS